ncbi:MAG: DUF465 domain-containing protein [Pseudomonadota bacterium]
MIDYSNFSEDALESRLADLRQDHADLDAAIQALTNTTVPDLIIIGRLKRKKLALKDEMARVEEFLNPDIIA